MPNIGSLIKGAAWEIRPHREPRSELWDGYATVDFEDWHFQIGIVEHTQTSKDGGSAS